MNAENYCPKCQRTLPADGPRGLCPACLLAVGLGISNNQDERNLSPAPTTPSGKQLSPPTTSDLAPLFLQLEIIEILGQGGMGTVYKARQKKLDRLVALKIVRSDAAADPAFAERFNREARTLARMSHPNIVAVHDFGEVQMPSNDAGTSQPLFYFVMEFVDGANLRQLMNGQRLESQQALAIVPQVCEALQYAHDEGVVHRDIKPENILVDHRGRVKIADFGLAKLVAGSSDDFTLTGTHQVMGTPRYMAPEQMEGSHAVDHRADIYSLGVVFYEMLTGQVPAGHFDPPSHTVDVDHRLDSIVLKAMARDPDRRFQRASEVRTQVDSVVSSSTPRTAALAELNSVTASVSGRPSPQTVSEFLSYEAVAAMGWLAGNSKTNCSIPMLIRWLAPVACMLAMATLFLPWISMYITDRFALDGIDSVSRVVDPASNMPAILREFTPVEHVTGMIAAVSLLILLIMQLAATGPAPTHRLWTILRLLAASVCVAALFCMKFEMNGTRISVNLFEDPRTSRIPVDNYQFQRPKGVGDVFIGDFEHNSRYSIAAFSGLSFLFCVLVINAVSLRYPTKSAGRSQRERKPARTLTPFQLSSRLLTVIGIVMILVAVVGGIAGVFMPVAVTSSDQLNNMRRIGSMILALLAIDIVLGAFAIVCGRQIQRGEWINICRFVCVIAVLFGNVTLPITAPLAIWCLLVLGKVRRGESSPDSNTRLGPANDSKSRPTQFVPHSLPEQMQVAMIVSAVLMAFSAALVGIMVAAEFSKMTVQSRSVYGNIGFIQVLCLPMSILMVAASHFVRQQRNIGLVRLVCMMGLVPLTLASVITIPITIWCLMSLYRLESAEKPSMNLQTQPGSPLQSAWISFWAERHTWTTRIVQTVLSLIFVACFVMFIGFSSASSVEYPTPGGPGIRTALVTLGQPSPWFEYSKNRNGQLGFTWAFHWTASSLWIMVFGMIIYLAYWQIEKARPGFAPTAIGSPKFMLIAVGVAGLLGLTFALLHGFLPDLKTTIAGDLENELLVEVRNGDAPAVMQLLKEGADPNATFIGQDAPLFWAVCNGDPAIIDALLQYGADVNVKDNNGVTPLMVASLKGDVQTVKLLISKGASVNQRDAVSGGYTIWPKTGSINWPGEQMTPLMLAASQGYRTIVETLLDAGAEPSLRDKAGKNAAELALEKKYYELHDVISLRMKRPAAEAL